MARVLRDIIEQIGQTQASEKWFEFPLLVAVSGGADSVALLRMLLELRQHHGRKDSVLFVAHVNHSKRGEESNEDERFVGRLAEALELEFRCERLNPETDRSEEALREGRYRALIKIAKQLDARYIATGHTSDDQVETILFRIFRGTGVAGLAGIPPIRVVDQSISIVRPLLHVTRAEVLSYLESLGQEFRTDSSNSDARYSRNIVRHEILPIIRERFGPTVNQSVVRLGSQSNELQNFLDRAAKALASSVITKSSDRLELRTVSLRQQEPILVRHFLIQCWRELGWPRQAMTSEWWSKIADSFEQDGNAQRIVLNLPAGIRFSIDAGIATFTRIA